MPNDDVEKLELSAKNHERAEIIPYMKANKVAFHILWMLVEDTRPLTLRQRTVYHLKQ